MTLKALGPLTGSQVKWSNQALSLMMRLLVLV